MVAGLPGEGLATDRKTARGRFFLLDRSGCWWSNFPMARQSFFRSPAVQADSKYGSYTPDLTMTARYKVIILIVALLGGACIGGAYSLIAANDLNKVARTKLRPGAEIRAKDEARKLARKKAEERVRAAAELEAAKKREAAEKLVQSSPLRNLLGGSPSAGNTTATASVRYTDEPPTRQRPRPRTTPKPKSETLTDVAKDARRMLEELK
jgi:hypothetical protein